MSEMAWSDVFPPLNLYNYPDKEVVCVFEEARRLGVVVLPGEVVQAIMFGQDKEKTK